MMDGDRRTSNDHTSGLQAPATSDDDTVNTPNHGEKVQEKSDMLNEKTLRFRFPSMTDGDPVSPSVVHARWMGLLQEEFGEAVQIYDNKNRIVKKLDTIRASKQLIKNHFVWYAPGNKRNPNTTPQTQANNRRVTTYLLHRIRTSCSLSEIKANAKVRALLKDHNFYVNEHRWNETEWDTTQLGFFFGIDPSFYNVDQATAKITAEIQKAMAGKRIPKFKLVFTSPKVTSGRKSISTKAYAIESQRQASQELIQVLKTAFKSTGAFVPYQMRNKHPDAFIKLIKAQTQLLAKNRVINLNHIGTEAMYYMSDHIQSVMGVQALLPTKYTDLGQYKVLVTEKDFKKVREHFQKYLIPWYDQYVEPDARNPESRYPGPPAVASIDADDYSEDEKSYMTVSVNTALSMTSVLSDDSSPESSGIPAHVAPRKWADVASDMSNHSSSSKKDTSNAVFSDASELISALSTSQAEVAILKEQVAELRAERETTAATIAEAVKQQVAQVLAAQLPRQVQADTITGQQFQLYMQMQDQKFDALTAMFTQMMTTQMSHHAVNEKPGVARGKRNAVQDLEEVHNVDRMETDVPATTRKRSDYRTTPKKASPPSEIIQDNDIAPRRIMEGEGPCQVPLPNSPPRENSTKKTPTPLDPPDPSTKEVQAKSIQAPTYQQQSMAKYLSNTIGMQNPSPPNEVNTNSGQSQDDDTDILSDAEDAHSTQSSGIESETPTTPTSTNRRRGLNPGV
jgi:hypothetical protein